MSEAASAEMKKTPFYKFHIASKAKMVAFAGFDMPIQYSSMTEEHLAVRENVGLFDISHMGEFELFGADALAFIQKMTVNDAAKLEIGQIQYSCMCYDDGGIVDDLLVYRLPDKYMLVVNGANVAKDFQWLEKHLEGDVKLVDVSEQIGLLAIQGPNAETVMEKVSDYDFSSLPYYHSAVVPVAGHDILLSRTGYTGEDGFEIYIPVKHAESAWQTIVDAGKDFNMWLIGLGARDSLRLEMKMALYGNDIDQTTTPIEASLSWVVDFDKSDFIARDILLRQKREKPERRLVCLELEGRLIPRRGYDVKYEGETIGRVTSGMFSPSLQKPIAMAYLPRRLSKIGARVELQIRDRLYPAIVVKPPFYKQGSHK